MLERMLVYFPESQFCHEHCHIVEPEQSFSEIAAWYLCARLKQSASLAVCYDYDRHNFEMPSLSIRDCVNIIFSVGKMTGYRLDDRGNVTSRVRIVHFAPTFISTLKLQPPIQRWPFPGAKVIRSRSCSRLLSVPEIMKSLCFRSFTFICRSTAFSATRNTQRWITGWWRIMNWKICIGWF
jgi:hypothetical protein